MYWNWASEYSVSYHSGLKAYNKFECSVDGGWTAQIPAVFKGWIEGGEGVH